MSTPDASLPKRPKGGMASLAADLTSRAGSLAHRSTDERLVPVVSAPGPAVDPHNPGGVRRVQVGRRSLDAPHSVRPVR